MQVSEPAGPIERTSVRHGDHVVTIELAPVDGRYEVVRFEMTSGDGRSPITATALRSVRIHELASEVIERRRRRLLGELRDTRTVGDRRRQVRAVTRKMAAGLTLAEPLPEIDAQPDNERRVSDEARRALDTVGEPRRPGRPPLPLEHYEEVAAIYRSAGGRRPVQVVAEAMNASRSTASGWVSRCRKLGLLGPTDERRAGERRSEGQR